MASNSDVSTLLREIALKSTTLEKNGESGRRDLLSNARSLCYKLETPIESLLRICCAEVRLTINNFSMLTLSAWTPLGHSSRQ